MTVAAFITSQRAEHQVPVATACRALGVSVSWYYKWRDRPPTPRQARAAALTDAIWGHFQASGYTYGSPRVWLDLYEDGWRVSKNTVARVMSEHAWHGRTPPRRRSLTRASDQNAAPDLVRRCFWSSRVDDRWVGDVTYVPTGQGWLYLATVIDLCSRRLLGYAMSSQHDSALTQAALAMAVATRRGEGRDPHGVVFHSDHGGEYAAASFAAACDRLGVTRSMGRVGSALDNAVAEATNSTLKVELIHRNCYATREEARVAIGAWISGFYNARRRHSACGGLSPIQYEQLLDLAPPVETEEPQAA